jgi:hypothetical protein
MVLLIPMGGVLWWILSWYTSLGIFHSIWISALTTLTFDVLIIHRKLKPSISKPFRKSFLIAAIETAIAAAVFMVGLATFTYLTLPPPDA